MDNKQMLFDLIKKNRDVLLNGHDYVVCNRILSKLAASILTSNSDKIGLDLNEISKLTDEEVAMFTSPECSRIIISLGIISNKRGWRVDTVLKLIKQLQQDILDNKMNRFSKEKEILDELYKIVEEEMYLDNYNRILDFIKMSVENGLLSLKDGTCLNFYVLKECSSYKKNKTEQEIEVLEIRESTENFELVRSQLIEVFAKYGYKYEISKFGDIEENFVKHVDVSYVDYVLSMFKKYGIDEKTLYSKKKALYNIIIDCDKESFDSILKFIDENNCSLKFMLNIPAAFSKKRKNYINRSLENTETLDIDSNTTLEIYGVQQDFFENIELYKKISGIEKVSDIGLDGLYRFLCTSSSLVKKNLDLLRQYKVIRDGKMPKSILALCGNSTEYLLDRYIEIGLYDTYLLPRYNTNGELKDARGMCYLDKDNNPFKFYKLKCAMDLGQSVFAANFGIRKVFRDDNENYMGISYVLDENGKRVIKQTPFTLEFMRSLGPEYRRQLPEFIKNGINTGEITEEDIGLIYFENLYRYKTFTPSFLFDTSNQNSLASLKGDRLNSVFAKDYCRVLSDEEIKNLELDSYISILDNAVYCDSFGDSSRVKVDDLRYEFIHPNFPNVKVTVSRYKVLRLCKLLKEDGCWINNQSSMNDKENTILSVLLKDSIVSEIELFVLKAAVKDILSNGLIRVSEIKENGRGAR